MSSPHQLTDSESLPPGRPPAPPDPSNDPGVIPPIKSPAPDDDDIPDDEKIDIFTLTPVAALKLLCRSIDALVRFTGDVPPTPPVRSRAPSPARPGSTPLRQDEEAGQSQGKENENHNQERADVYRTSSKEKHMDGIPFTKTPIGSPEAHHSEPTDPHIIGSDAEPLHIQHGHLARKFYSKRPPPISTTDYLLRLHKYCPMSTAVYLATSCYITRMAVHERILPVTPRNVHRLLLAGLRVAMKALEDLSWPHARFSRVGGVSEKELGRLEVTFCFLMGFELRIDAEQLTKEAEALRGLSSSAVADSPVSMTFDIKIPEMMNRTGESRDHGEKRKASSVLPSRPAIGLGVGVE